MKDSVTNRCGGQTHDPYLDAGMHGYIRSLATREYWRVAHWYGAVSCGLDDAIQDGYLCYAKCRHRYVDVLGALPAQPEPEHRKWMMSLVKTTFGRYLRHIIAGKSRLGYEVPVSQLGSAEDPEDGDIWEQLLPPQLEEASLASLLVSLPSELQQLLVLLAGDGAEALGFERSRLEHRVTSHGSVRVQRRGRRRLRETTNEYYCRLIGADPTVTDLRGKLRALVDGGDV